MKKYTLGFIFTPDYSQVLLVQKNRPDWQVGKWNGIGGHIEEGETSIECIVREIEEETALKTTEKDWVCMGSMGTSTFNVDSFVTVYNGDMADAKTMTDEKIAWHELKNLPETIINNLAWLIPLALDMHKNDTVGVVRADYKEDFS